MHFSVVPGSVLNNDAATVDIQVTLREHHRNSCCSRASCALPVHFLCTSCALPLHFLCTSCALPLHFLCTSSALPLAATPFPVPSYRALNHPQNNFFFLNQESKRSLYLDFGIPVPTLQGCWKVLSSTRKETSYISRILWNLEFHYHINKGPPPVPTLAKTPTWVYDYIALNSSMYEERFRQIL